MDWCLRLRCAVSPDCVEVSDYLGRCALPYIDTARHHRVLPLTPGHASGCLNAAPPRFKLLFWCRDIAVRMRVPYACLRDIFLGCHGQADQVQRLALAVAFAVVTWFLSIGFTGFFFL